MELEATITERRRQTRGGIYRHIYKTKQFCSKQTLAHDLQLSLPTVYQHLKELMDAGLIRYSGKSLSTGGRKAMGLDIVPGARVAAGVSISQNHMRMLLADLRLRELRYRERRLEPYTGLSQLRELLAGELERLLGDLDRERLLGVGIALPGIISQDSRSLVFAPVLALQDPSLESLAAGIPYPVRFENDGNCGGYAEWFLQDDRQNIAYISLENGVGGAVLIGGTPYEGDRHHSGEFGHICVEPDGLLCSCGKRGCLEAYCTTRRIQKDLGVSLEEFFSGVEDQVPEYCALLDDLLRHLAIGVKNIRMVLDCDVILGGTLSEFLPPYMERLRRCAAEGNPFSSSEDCLRLSTLRKHSVPLGAALGFITDFLENL